MAAHVAKDDYKGAMTYDALTKADKNDAALTGALGSLAERMEQLALSLVKKG